MGLVPMAKVILNMEDLVVAVRGLLGMATVVGGVDIREVAGELGVVQLPEMVGAVDLSTLEANKTTLQA